MSLDVSEAVAHASAIVLPTSSEISVADSNDAQVPVNSESLGIGGPVWVPGEAPTELPIPVTSIPMTGPDTGPTATHALRNRHKSCIPASHQSKRQGKFTRFLSRQAAREKKAALQRDLRAFRMWREQEIRKIARRHNKRPELIQQLVLKKTSFRSKRRAMIQNALVHMKAKELNANREPGDRVPLKEIQAEVKEFRRNNPVLSEELKEEILAAIEELREMRSLGVRKSNKAAALDYQNTIKRIEWEIKALAERTGAVGFACFSRGHINDSLFPAWMDSKDALQFFSDMFKLTPSEITRQFETWAIAQEAGARSSSNSDRTKVICRECISLINNGLNSVMNRSNLEMQYLHYKRKICLAFGIHLRGWPGDVPFESPSKLNATDARKLRDALRCGTCIWTSMTHQEYKTLSESLEDQPVPLRAPRKDKGQARGKRKQTEVNETPESTQQASKRPRKNTKKAAKQLPPMRSAEFINDSDSE